MHMHLHVRLQTHTQHVATPSSWGLLVAGQDTLTMR